MSLQVWLPLTKDLRNQGLSNVTVTNNGATFNSAGKLGGCYEFASGKRIQTTLPTSTSLNTKAISFACWMYVTSWNSSYDCFMSIADGTGWVQSRATLCRNNTASTLTWNIADGTNRAYVTTTTALSLNTWTHVAGTYDGTNLKIYINGVLNNTSATTLSIGYAGTFNIGGWSGNNYPFNGRLNDVRIYNHCLSPMEVKELAKGLVLHYPLSDPSNDEKENLMPSNYWSGTKTISLSANTTNYGVINYPAISVETDTTYFWTVNFRIISGGNNLTSIGVDTNCSGGSYSGNDSAHTVITTVHPNLTRIKAGEWQTAYCITKVKADATNPTIFHTIYGCSSTATTLTVEWRNLMLVESTEVVPFRGQHSNIIYDCSGFCNNGAIVGTLTISNDTPKYQVSTHIGSTSSKVHISNFPTSGFGNTYSFAWWGKNTTFSNKMFWGFSDGIRLNGMYSGVLWNTGDSSNNPLYKINTTTQVSAPSVNTWHHYVMTGNGTKCYVYLDGELWAEAKTYKAISGTSIYINGWGNTTDYCYDNMDISDFRIYATALSASDVKSLYQNSAYIDSSGNVYGTIHEV